jgi:hypothetical protein
MLDDIFDIADKKLSFLGSGVCCGLVISKKSLL